MHWSWVTPAVCGPRVTPLFAPAEWRPSEPACRPVEVRRAGSPGPASEVQVKWPLWVIAVTAALVGGPAPMDSLPSRLKSRFSGGLPQPAVGSRPPPPVPLKSLVSAQKCSRTLVRSLPHPPRGTQGCASQDSGGIPVGPCCSPARLTVSAPGLAEEMLVKWSKSVCALTVAHCRDYRKLCLCPLHGLKIRSVKTVLTD